MLATAKSGRLPVLLPLGLPAFGLLPFLLFVSAGSGMRLEYCIRLWEIVLYLRKMVPVSRKYDMCPAKARDGETVAVSGPHNSTTPACRSSAGLELLTVATLFSALNLSICSLLISARETNVATGSYHFDRGHSKARGAAAAFPEELL